MRNVFFFVAISVFTLSCQKEVSHEINIANVTAAFTFSGAPDACTIATPDGYYAAGAALSAANTISVQVTVTDTGSYTIATNSVNGYQFTATGNFKDTGTQTIKLIGSGTPLTAQTDSFIPSMTGIKGCNFSINVTAASPAEFVLAGAPAACTDMTVNGVYELGTALKTDNTVTVKVNVSKVGTFSLATNTAGGMNFSKSGSFGTTGIQTVTLNGSGTPTTAGDNELTIGTGGCIFIVPVTGPAEYSLSGTPGQCTAVAVGGTYTVGVPLLAANTASIQVNVSTPGAFNISTAAGGMIFSKSGVFTTSGIQQVVLQGSGTPSTSGTNTFTVGTNGCTFEVTVIVAPVTAGVFQCKIDGVLTTFNDRAKAQTLDNFFNPPTPYIYLDGYTAPPNGDNIPEFQIFITKNDNAAVGAGTYNESSYVSLNGYRIEIDYKPVNPDLSVTLWNTSSTLFPPPNPPFTIVITSISATNIKGTFNGKLTNLLEGGTQIKTITEGVFDLPIIN